MVQIRNDLCFLLIFLLQIQCTTAMLDGDFSDSTDTPAASTITITNVTPSGGSISGGTTITITGTGFHEGITVSVGGVACTPVTIVSSTSLTCVTGAHSSGTGTVVISDGSSQSVSASISFSFQPAPTVTSISPAAGIFTGGTTVTVTGTGFLSGAAVKIGGVTCNGVSVSSETSLTCTTGSATAGLTDVVVTNSDNQVGTLSSGYLYQPNVISSWSFVDGNGVNGINKNTIRSANNPNLTAFNSKLYATWYESNAGAISQVRMSVYNGNDNSPVWSFVDGNGANGLNKNTTQTGVDPNLTVFNSKLYATWTESNLGPNNQIRMSVYNGNDSSPVWSFVDGNGATGINKDVTAFTFSPQLTVFNSKLYSMWTENSFAKQIRMSVYNGNDNSPVWSFVDGNGATGINKNTALHAAQNQFTVFNSKLYATWAEETAGGINQTRMAVYNGNDSSPVWSFVDGNGANGINKNVMGAVSSPQLTVFNSKLYSIWTELCVGGTGTNQPRVVVYNGNDSSPVWTFVDGNGGNGLNKDTSRTSLLSQLTVSNGYLYATWYEATAGATQIRMSVYNGNDSSPTWTFVDGNGVNGINKDTSTNALSPQLTEFNSKLYSTWHEGGTSQIRMAVGQ